jgi:nitrilase
MSMYPQEIGSIPADTYPSFKAAAVQAAPVWLNRDATIEKVEALTTQAAALKQTDDTTNYL